MTITDLYFASSREGDVSDPGNALAAPDGTYTTDAGDTSWTASWFLEEFTDGTKDDLTGTQLFTATVRKDAVLGRDPTLDSMTLFIKTGASSWTSHTLVGSTTVTDLTSEVSGSVDASDFSTAVNMTEHYIEFVVSASGGPPNDRRTIQLDAVNWDAQWEEPTPEGDLDATMGGLQGALAADSQVNANADAALPGLQGSFESELNDAQLAPTLGPLQGSFAADAQTDASLEGTLGSLQGSFGVDVIVDAELSTALGSLQGSFEADAQVDVDIDAALGSLQGSFGAEQEEETTEGELAGTLGSLQGSFNADAQADADLASTLGSLQGAFEADHGDDNTADLNATLGSLQALVEGEQNEADAAPSLGSLRGSFDADAITEAEIASTLSALQASFDADHGDDNNAELDASLGPLQSSSEGSINEADVSPALGSLQGSFDADAQVEADTDSALSGLQGSFEANHGDDTTADLDASMGPLQGTFESDANTDAQLVGSLRALQSLLDATAFLEVVVGPSLPSMGSGFNSVHNGGPVGGGLASLSCVFEAQRLNLIAFLLAVQNTKIDPLDVVTAASVGVLDTRIERLGVETENP